MSYLWGVCVQNMNTLTPYVRGLKAIYFGKNAVEFKRNLPFAFFVRHSVSGGGLLFRLSPPFTTFAVYFELTNEQSHHQN